MENINTVEYWNGKYKEMYEKNINGIGVNEDRRMYFQSMFVYPNDTILEIGCGDATFYKFLTKYGKTFKKYIGTEISPYIVEKNRKECPNAEFIQTGTEIAPIDCEIVDRIFCMHVIEHIENPELHINEWLKSLKKGGMLILSVPFEDNEYPEHLRIYTEDECDKLMSKIDCKIQYEFYIRRLGWRFPEDNRSAKEIVMVIIKNETNTTETNTE